MRFKNKAVVLGTNYYIGLGIVRALGRNNVYVTTVDYENSHYGVSKYVKEHLIGPHYEKEEKELVKFLIDYSKKQECKPVLYPTADLYVEFMEKNFDELKEYYLWPIEKKGILSELMDKSSLLKYTEPLGIKTPEIIPMQDENLYERVNNELGYPCIVKPRDSMPFVNKYRQKVIIVENENELKRTIEMCKKDNQEVFVQRIVKGPETNCYSFDVYMDKNQEVQSYMTTCKIRQWPINFGASTYAKQVYIKELYDICVPLFKAMKFSGFAEVELKRDIRNNVIYVIEVNVRFVNFVALQEYLGMNTPLMYYYGAIDEEYPFKKPKITRNTETHWKYLYEDISATMAYLKSGQMNLFDIIKTYKLKKASAILSLDDPKPGFEFFKWAIMHKISK